MSTIGDARVEARGSAPRPAMHLWSGTRFDSRTESLVFVTYRPSLVAGVIHDQVGAYLIAPTAIEAERYFMTGLLRRHGPSGLVPHDALGELERQRVGLLRLDGAGPDWRVFTPGARLAVHTHHGRKYADARLPEDRAFRFLGGNGSVIATAHSVIEFCAAVTFVGMDSLRHHLLHGDFSRSVVYGSDPIRLVDELLRVYRIAHYRRPSCFCAERPPGEGDATPGTSRDPVCGMQIAPAAAAAERVIGGERYVFCSPSCASRFDASPERYVSTGAIVADAAKSSERPAP